MKKYLLRYLIFWLPAVLAAYFYNNASAASQVLQWFCAFFMVLGWAVNTSMAAYRYPRKTMALLLGYAGIHILIITMLYSAQYGTAAEMFLLRYGGMFSYRPLDIVVMALLDFNIMHEMYVTLFLVFLCFAGFAAGVFYRRLVPDPYRPRILPR